VNTYQSLHARHYDLIYAGKPYADEAAFVDRVIARPRGALLDLACGTGRHAVEFSRLGWAVTGVDYGADLLERARVNAQTAGVEVALHEQDMRQLDLGAQRFDAVTCLFDSIGYPQTDEGIVAALSAARRHLEPDGVLVAEFLHGPAMIAGYDPLKVRTWPLDGGGELLRVSRTRLDVAASVMHVAYELLELASDGRYRRATEEQANRYFTVSEMRGLLRQAGLAEREFLHAYDDDPAVTADTWHVLAVATPASGGGDG
jgi:ubiquinone/menaquinone biosynthesis C-methylase UbiE